MIGSQISREEFNTKYKYNSHTPMMQQYLDVKFEHQDCLVLFRMGDFYELFFDDAISAAKILGIILAKRGKLEEENIPMCGVPHHAMENYLPKLIEQNLKIAICDQLETPEEAKKRGGYKAVVKREVTRIITPGTIFEDVSLERARPNYLCSVVALSSDLCALGFADITTSEFKVTHAKLIEVLAEINKYQPKEILISDSSYKILANYPECKKYNFVFQPDIFFDYRKNSNSITEFYAIKSIGSIGDLSNSMISAIGSIIQYIILTQKGNLPKLYLPKIYSLDNYIKFDPSTRKSLELTHTQNGKYKGSLLSVIDKTVTPGGARQIYEYILSPLTSIEEIKKRQNLVEIFYENQALRDKLSEILKSISDIERILNKIASNRALPQHLVLLKNSLASAYLIKEELYKEYGLNIESNEINYILQGIDFNADIIDLLHDSILDEPSNNLNDGGYIKPSFDPKLSEIYDLVDNFKNHLDNLRIKYQKLTGIDNIKISANNIIGYYLEVTSKNIDKIDNNFFKYKQSTSNSIRYTTQELFDLEKKLNDASFCSVSLEREIFTNICAHILEKFEILMRLSKSLSEIDVYTSLAKLAEDYGYVKPEITEGDEFEISNGRHPVVEEYLMKSQEYFVPNSCILNNNTKLLLITGPNMGGKSTYLRQNAIIAILAQIGSFVPAERARLGVIDKIFSRLGAGDELSEGRSTFMIEMLETSSILAQATAKSLVILDEVGRGTSTHDGMSIAWSIVEYLHNKIGCKTLFATHYHELTELSKTLSLMQNYNAQVEEEAGKIKFTHKIIKGPADKSYGIHVAEIAGLPKQVLSRSREILKIFEKENAKNLYKNLEESHSLNLFSASQDSEYLERLNNLKEKILSKNIDDISPREAHEILYNLQKVAKDS